MYFRSLLAALVAFTSIAGMLPRQASAREAPIARIIVKWMDQGVSFGAQSSQAVPVLRNIQQQFGVSAQSLRVLATGAEVLRLDRVLTKQELAQFMDAIRSSGAVEYVEEDILVKAAAVPADPLYTEQWAYFDPVGGMFMPPAWGVSAGSDVIVAVLDSGYASHSDLDANLVGGYDFISDATLANDGGARDEDAHDPGDANPAIPECATSTWHGTRVAGTIAAVAHNAVGGVGTAFGARILPVRVLGLCGLGYISDVADGVIWAAGGAVRDVQENTHRAKVINLSLSARAECSATLSAATMFAEDHGAVVVGAAGNDGADPDDYLPVNCPAVIGVSALNRDGTRRSDSNLGGRVWLAAPGESLSTSNSGITAPESESYASYTGTSAAAAHVSGVAALVVSRLPTFERGEIADVLRASARPITCLPSCRGIGIADASAALAVLDLPPRPPATVSVNPHESFDGSYIVSWAAALLATQYVIERLIDSIWIPGDTVTGTSREWMGQPPGDYNHRVKACNANGCSDWSMSDDRSRVFVRDVTLIPPRPASISAPPFTIDSGYTVSWPSAARAAEYVVAYNAGSGWINGVFTTGLSYRFRGLTTGEYQNRVKACNINGCSDWRTGASVTVALHPPPKPTTLTVTPLTTYSGYQDLTWSSSLGATGYVVQRSFNSVWGREIPVGDQITLGFSDQDVGEVQHRVKACNVHGCSDWKVGPVAQVAAPRPPASISASPAVTQTRNYAVSWPASRDTAVHHYILQRANPTTWGTDVTVSGTSKSYTGVMPGQYRHRVKACNDNGACGGWVTGASVRVCGLGECD
jgi:serine protease